MSLWPRIGNILPTFWHLYTLVVLLFLFYYDECLFFNLFSDAIKRNVWLMHKQPCNCKVFPFQSFLFKAPLVLPSWMFWFFGQPTLALLSLSSAIGFFLCHPTPFCTPICTINKEFTANRDLCELFKRQINL